MGISNEALTQLLLLMLSIIPLSTILHMRLSTAKYRYITNNALTDVLPASALSLFQDTYVTLADTWVKLVDSGSKKC
jgi:hypothetical protein